MHEFVALNLSREEYGLMVRLLGHHTCGEKFQPIYERLHNLRNLEATIAENKGPLCRETPICAADLYGKRPMVKADD